MGQQLVEKLQKVDTISSIFNSRYDNIDINSTDCDNSTCLTIALKNKHTEIAKYLLKFDNVDIMVKSAKIGNAINLAMKI